MDDNTKITDSNRVLYDILTDRLALLRELDHEGDSDRRRHVARETRDLHSQLAHRLGLYAIKTEMEDLALKFTDYTAYKGIAHALNETRAQRDAYIESFINPLASKLTEAGFVFTIKGRPKSIHSIYHKMLVQHCDVDHIYDLFAIRIILDSPPEREKQDCWQVYSLITDMYQPNPKRLRDWLSVPKENGYESLHTTVLGPQDKWVEVQIRTRRMDEVAERGVAAHWAYKGVDGSRMNTDRQSVYVFTPAGDLRRLPAGATVLDFAFSIHSEVGCHCVGGRIRNQNVSIRQKLENGDQVIITTSPNQHPNADWLTFAASQRAKNKIRQALKEIEYRNAAEGRELFERRLKNWKLDYDEARVARMATKLGYKAVSDFYESLAQGREDVLRLKDLYLNTDTHDTPHLPSPNPTTTTASLALEVDVHIKNVDYKLAQCCNPKPDDPIFGFVSVTNGIRIHRIDCPNAQHMREHYPYRLIPARWKDHK